MTTIGREITRSMVIACLFASVCCAGCGILTARSVYEYYRLEDGLDDSWQGEDDLDFVRGGIELAASLCPQLECFLFYLDSETGPGGSAKEVKGGFYGIGARSTDPSDPGISLDWSLRLGRLDMEDDDDHFANSHILGTTSGYR